MSRISHLYGQQGNRWLPKDDGAAATALLVAVSCWCGSWLVAPHNVGVACEFCSAPQEVVA